MRIPHLSAGAAVVLLAMGTACNGPALTPEQTLALRQAQTRTFEVPMDTAFKATMTYLQDNHYQIKQASKDSGMIYASKAQMVSTGSAFLGALLVGPTAKGGDHYDVTFTFDGTSPASTRVRCNITHGESTLGGTSAGVRAVTDPAMYKSVLEGLTLEVQRMNMARGMESAPAAPAQP